MIAVIGWGSLIWDIENLAPFVTGTWHMRGGPILPMEFSRVSAKRKMGLAVCLDPEHGTECPTHVITSVQNEIQIAVADLARRERAPMDMIGWATADNVHGRLPDVNQRVQAWLANSLYAGAVWTDLDPNFASHTGTDFTIPRAIAYLKTLNKAQLDEAYRYIQEAPATTVTRLRTVLAYDPWWQSLK